MRFKKFKNGSCDLEFSWKERWLIFRKGKIHFSDEGLRHFGNILVGIVSSWQHNFNEKTKRLKTPYTERKKEE